VVVEKGVLVGLSLARIPGHQFVVGRAQGRGGTSHSRMISNLLRVGKPVTRSLPILKKLPLAGKPVENVLVISA
jgi:hypothetical protein